MSGVRRGREDVDGVVERVASVGIHDKPFGAPARA